MPQFIEYHYFWGFADSAPATRHPSPVDFFSSLQRAARERTLRNERALGHEKTRGDDPWDARPVGHCG